jgi:hypothetical protein
MGKFPAEVQADPFAQAKHDSGSKYVLIHFFLKKNEKDMRSGNVCTYLAFLPQFLPFRSSDKFHEFYVVIITIIVIIRKSQI